MKKLFDTPKKAILSTIGLTAIVLTAAVAVPSVILSSTLIGKAEAEEAARKDAGLTVAEVSGSRTELDFEDGRFQYEVDFYSNGVEYEYVILAKDGTVIKRDTDGERLENKNQQSTSSKEERKNLTAGSAEAVPAVAYEESSSDTAQLTAEQAQQVALAAAGLTQDEVTFTESRLDKEDGLWVYDMEFYSVDTEYDCEIDAVNGTVREWKVNSFQRAVLTLEEAKKAALDDAGFTEADVTFTKERLTKDDSAEVYDIEFYTADAEYDYEIDGADGTVKERKAEAFLTQADSNNAAGADSYIGIDKAKEIALNHSGLLAAEVQFSKAKLENDDGRTEYEVEFYSGRTEYDYTIDAVSGAILEYDTELD
ncbi:MAG: PepSY domain-containing protein [Ruminococcus sp.]|nr:PepSY domain-containing protein [Ruminococcus sp.]